MTPCSYKTSYVYSVKGMHKLQPFRKIETWHNYFQEQPILYNFNVIIPAGRFHRHI